MSKSKLKNAKLCPPSNIKKIKTSLNDLTYLAFPVLDSKNMSLAIVQIKNRLGWNGFRLVSRFVFCRHLGVLFRQLSTHKKIIVSQQLQLNTCVHFFAKRFNVHDNNTPTTTTTVTQHQQELQRNTNDIKNRSSATARISCVDGSRWFRWGSETSLT